MPQRQPEGIVVPCILRMSIVVLGLTPAVFSFFLPQGEGTARTAAFLVISRTQVFNMFNMRALEYSVFEIGIV
ncbi:cation transporting ATPase C-terminal domain-containing protein [Pontibacter flavimaris]|uniref:Cation-transporting P-type ATPase C-terminal domain-containing protein n=1 Tax=Pontibacter flavimaris TaxID=1797110 RepID=A0A1Q5PGM1_9BACT|nr:cation transporting ATPase C-terminal domain-containing protein [Pontibacter flavimaris]OKL41365.1 hypothetical protein A3841_09885 [Pontibacter flavimaris]